MFRYFISKEFFLTLLGLAGLGIVVYMIIFFVFLPGYTRHGASILVPDVNEMPHNEAILMLSESGLRFEVRDCTYIADLPTLTVTAQYPIALSRVKPNRTVFLTVNQLQPPMVKIPEILDVSLFQAQTRLENWKLAVGSVTRVPDLAENMVLKVMYNGQETDAGDMVPQGSKIDIVIGDGLIGGIRVAVPELIGLSYDEALNELRTAGLGVGEIIYNPDGPLEETGLIYKQNPRFRVGDSLKSGYPIDLYIYGEEPETEE